MASSRLWLSLSLFFSPSLRQGLRFRCARSTYRRQRERSCRCPLSLIVPSSSSRRPMAQPKRNRSRPPMIGTGHRPSRRVCCPYIKGAEGDRVVPGGCCRLSRGERNRRKSQGQGRRGRNTGTGRQGNSESLCHHHCNGLCLAVASQNVVMMMIATPCSLSLSLSLSHIIIIIIVVVVVGAPFEKKKAGPDQAGGMMMIDRLSIIGSGRWLAGRGLWLFLPLFFFFQKKLT